MNDHLFDSIDVLPQDVPEVSPLDYQTVHVSSNSLNIFGFSRYICLFRKPPRTQ